MKKLLITLCVIVLAVCVHAQPKVIEIPTATAGVMLLGGGASSPAASCATQTNIDDDNSATVQNQMYDDHAFGFQFTTGAGEAGDVYSVHIDIGANEATAGSKTIYARLDNDVNFTADIIGGTASASVAHDKTGDVEIVWAAVDRPTIAGSTTYYVGIYYEPVSYSDRITISGGSWQGSGGNMLSYSSDWVFTTNANYNLAHEVMLCD